MTKERDNRQREIEESVREKEMTKIVKMERGERDRERLKREKHRKTRKGGKDREMTTKKRDNRQRER